MSTNRPNDADISANVTPLSQLTLEEMAAIADPEYRHVDYDRHPLRVQGLDHYIDQSQFSERFHVW
jgi:hypothetical protein